MTRTVITDGDLSAPAVATPPSALTAPVSYVQPGTPSAPPVPEHGQAQC